MNELWQCYAKWNKSEKDKYCMISFICGLKKKIYQLIEQIGGCQNQGMEVGEVSEGSQRYKRPLIKWISPWDVIDGMVTTVNNTTLYIWKLLWGFPGDSDDKESACNAGDPGSTPGLGRSPGEGDSNPLQCSCLENSMDRGAWWATVHEVTKSWTRLRD